MTDQTTIPLPQTSSAIISACGKYRYVLTRQVGPSPKVATFIMFNPSTADAEQDDPTIRRCIGFARQWNCGKLVVLNLFAFRATDPADLKRAADPVGPDNQTWFIRSLADDADFVVCGWGFHGQHVDQDLIVLDRLQERGIDPLALGVTKDGHPRHTLYMPYSAEPWRIRGGTARTDGDNPRDQARSQPAPPSSP